MIDLLIRNASVQDSRERLDFAVDHGILIDRGVGLTYPSAHQFDLDGRLLNSGIC